MANPFSSKFDSHCQSCGKRVNEGREMYSVESLFVCVDCARAGDNICECGAFKKSEYEECFNCHEENA